MQCCRTRLLQIVNGEKRGHLTERRGKKRREKERERAMNGKGNRTQVTQVIGKGCGIILFTATGARMEGVRGQNPTE